ncbi:unnamed protein product, partial [Phaeothamnion confervicola]
AWSFGPCHLYAGGRPAGISRRCASWKFSALVHRTSFPSAMGDYDQNGYGGDEPDASYGGDSGLGQGQQSFGRAPADDGQAFLLPDSVKDFVFDLHDSMRRSQILEELETFYTDTFKTLSDAYFKQSGWPAATVMSDQCGGDELFLCFYEELRLRHAFASTNATTVHDRFAAWANYCRLFDALLACRDTRLVISAQWAFDIVHEFVYQFQGFCQFRTQLSHRNAEERALLAANQDVWAVQNVMSYLHGLARVSNIVPILDARRQNRPATAAGTAGGAAAPAAPASPVAAPAPAPSQAHHMMGYFSLVATSRLQCLLADYGECLKAVGPLDILDKAQPLAATLPAYVSLHMHMGVSFLMLRRYRDAARAFNEILVHISRAFKTGQLQRYAAADHITAQADKMVALLAIATTLAPGLRLDEQIAQTMREANRDKLAKMAEGDEAPFRELFSWAAPKFVLHEQQVRLFVEDVRQQLAFPQIRSYLKLYTTIGLEKMARFNGMDERAFQAALVSMKHKLTQQEWAMSPEMGPLGGKPALALDFNYYVEGDMIHIDEAAKEQRFERFFMSQISKCDNIAQQAARVKV